MTRERMLVSTTLRGGVFASFALLAAGVVMSAFDPPAALIVPAPLAPLIAGAVRFDSTALIHLGLLVLMLTPFTRVAVLAAHFIRDRELPFALMSIGVLCLLTAAVVVGVF